MDKVLTIVIPTYNMEKYLRHCLDSLIVPNMDKVEVLVINDGSKDTSSTIGHEYQDKYPQTFRVIDKENGNYGSCINRGLREATGKYIKVLDSDDYFNSNDFNKLILALDNCSVDMVVTDFTQVDESYHVTNKKRFSIPTNKELSFHDYCSNILATIEMHAICYKKSIFNNLNYHQSEGISYTDQEWVSIPMATVKSFKYFPLDIYQYLVGREGQTMTSENLKKHIGDTIKGIYTMVDSLNAIKSSLQSFRRDFLEYRIIKRLNYVYLTGLIFGYLPNNEMIEFDDRIKNDCRAIYHKVKSRECHRIRIPYIFLWRLCGRRSLSKSIILLTKKWQKL